MDRIVIQLGRSKDDVWFALREPAPQEEVTHTLTCAVTDPDFAALRGVKIGADSVKVAGSRLFQELVTKQDIQQHLTTALATAVGGRLPIAIKMGTTLGVEALPWEAMCAPSGDYLGLDERWALARMVQPRTEGAPFYLLTPPVKIAAVLSCLDISAQGELDALRAAIQRAGGRHVQLLVVTSEDRLYMDLEAELKAATWPCETRLEMVPGDLAGLHRLVSDFGPHVLHFFCHGSLEASAHLLIAKKEDWCLHPRVSSITAEAGEFSGFTSRTGEPPWITVLNCCEGAGVTSADSQSLARTLVAEGVTAAAVGMREPVVDTTANQLTEALYGELLSELATRIEAAETTPANATLQPLDWPRLLVAARERLASVRGKPKRVAAGSRKEWTLPVIYVRPQDFLLQVSEPAVVGGGGPRGRLGGERANEVDERAARLEIQLLQTLLTDLPPEQAGVLKGDAMKRIKVLSGQLGVELPEGPT